MYVCITSTFVVVLLESMHSKNQTVSTSANGPNSKISRPNPLIAAVTHSVHIILASISPCPLTPRGCDKRYSSPEYFRDSGRGIMATSEKKRTKQTKVREGPPPVASPPKRKPWMNAVRDILPTQTETDASRGSRGSRLGHRKPARKGKGPPARTGTTRRRAPAPVRP